MALVKAALAQVAWPGDKDKMIQKHVDYIGQAAKQGAKVMCLQELFYGPYFCPGNLGYPVFDTAVGKVGIYICYDRHFPEGARMLGLHGAELVFIPSATSRGLSMHLWFIEQTSHAIANGYWVGTINRVGKEAEFGPNDYYGSSYFADPRGKIVAQAADKEEQLLVAALDMDLVREVRNTWQVYRDRRPDMYQELVKP